jgi:hypothetical protein
MILASHDIDIAAMRHCHCDDALRQLTPIDISPLAADDSR